MYRISVTTIEKFRRYIVGASIYDTEQALLESIKGIFLGNDKTKVGSAYHKIIEGEALVAEGGLVADDIFFTADQARPALEFREAHPLMVHEVPATKVYETKRGPILVSGRIDGVEGKELEDKKCKFRSVDVQEYVDSYQWRYYLDMLLADRFFYDLFEVKGFQALVGFKPFRLAGVSFHPHDRLELYRYAGMPGDCLGLLNDFLDYIELRQLWPFLKKAEPQPAA